MLGTEHISPEQAQLMHRSSGEHRPSPSMIHPQGTAEGQRCGTVRALARH